jgi:nitroimidazol reductase NimA-like FMN-containing flavoprotein (pyridoxamine 5'-phosphate oxidase superfamily)
MTLGTPVTDLDSRFSSAGATALPWTAAEEQLQKAGVFWVTTVRAEGRPHVVPLIAVWLEGALYFCTGEGEQKAKNIANNAQVVITTGSNSFGEGLDIVVEGEAVELNDGAKLGRVADAYRAKYGEGWSFTVRDGKFSPDTGSSGGDEVRVPVFEVAPAKVFGFSRADPRAGGPWRTASRFSQTRWRFQR